MRLSCNTLMTHKTIPGLSLPLAWARATVKGRPKGGGRLWVGRSRVTYVYGGVVMPAMGLGEDALGTEAEKGSG